MKSLGQIAYEAYATKVDWKSPFTGQTLKEWDTLKIMNPIVVEAWECAALIVAGQPRVKVLAHVVNGNLVRYKGEPSHHALAGAPNSRPRRIAIGLREGR